MTQAMSGTGGGYDLSLLPYDGIEDLVNADPDVIVQFTSGYQQMADAAQQSAAGLRSSTATYTWEGQAADAFRGTVQKVPATLDTVSTSMGAAGQALAGYGPSTEDAQNQILSLLSQLEAARSAQQAAQATLSSATSAMHSANNAVSNPPSGQTKAEAKAAGDAASQASGNYASAQTAANNADESFTSLQRQGQNVLSGWVAQRASAASAIREAGSHAPHQSWLDSALSSFVDVVKGVGDFAWDVVKGIGKTFEDAADLPSAIVNVVLHPMHLSSWERLGRDAVAAGTVALMVTGVGEVAEGADGVLAGADAAADAGEGTAESAASTAGAVATEDGGEAATEDAGKTFTQQVVEKATLKNAVNGANYGQEAYKAGDDAVNGRWGEVGTDLAGDAVGDVAGSVMDDGMLLHGHLSVGGEDFKGISSLTGYDQASSEGNAVKDFAGKVAAGDDNQAALARMSAADRDNLLKAAGMGTGKDLTPDQAFNKQFINSLDPAALRQSAANNILHTGLRNVAATQVGDQVKETAVDQGRDAANHALGLYG